jgi:hypothetical protein
MLAPGSDPRNQAACPASSQNQNPCHQLRVT